MQKLAALALAVSFLVVSAGSLVADDAPAANGKRPNPEAVFKKIDTNGDGKLSKEEFKAFIEKAAKAGGKVSSRPELVDKLFNRLDANADGYLSLEEFKKLGELRKALVEKKAKKGTAENAKSE